MTKKTDTARNGLQEGRPLRGAIVGFGFISHQGHFSAYQQRKDVTIVAIADTCENQLKKAKELLPHLRVYSDFESLLKSETELDFVDISTPPAFHVPYAILALQHGLHVLCEKPLATSTLEVGQLFQAAQENSRVVFPCHNYKHAPVVKAIKEVLTSGEIGTVTALNMTTLRTTHAKGVKEWKTDWRREKNISGGGIAMDHGSHTFYLTFDWFQSLPTKVTAKMSTAHAQWNTEDNFTCVLTFPQGEAHCHLSWTAGTRSVMYNIQGTRGAIFINEDDIEVRSNIVSLESTGVTANTRKFSVASHWNDASHVEWFSSMFDLFLKAIQKSDFINSELKEAAMCIEIIERAYESSEKKSLELELRPISALKTSL